MQITAHLSPLPLGRFTSRRWVDPEDGLDTAVAKKNPFVAPAEN